jgi:hypothetical protein
VSLRGWLKRIEREAREDFVEVRQRDGRVLYFERMEVLKALFLARYDAALGRSPEPSAVLDALEGATLESRRAVEEISSTGTFFDLEPRDPTGPYSTAGRGSLRAVGDCPPHIEPRFSSVLSGL